MADDEERVKAEKLAAAKKRVSIAHSGLKPAYNAEKVTDIILIKRFLNRWPNCRNKRRKPTRSPPAQMLPRTQNPPKTRLLLRRKRPHRKRNKMKSLPPPNSRRRSQRREKKIIRRKRSPLNQSDLPNARNPQLNLCPKPPRPFRQKSTLQD